VNEYISYTDSYSLSFFNNHAEQVGGHGVQNRRMSPPSAAIQTSRTKVKNRQNYFSTGQRLGIKPLNVEFPAPNTYEHRSTF
jgi:hypothetical protein